MNENKYDNSQIFELSDILFKIKEKITDNEYMESMNKLNNIRKCYNELIDSSKNNNVCNCVVNSSKFCDTSFERLMQCKNLQPTLKSFPILRNLVILYGLPEHEHYNSFHYYKTTIQFELIELYKYINREEAAKKTNIIRMFLNIIESNNSVLIKIIFSITLFDYIFKNASFLVYHFKFLEVNYNKLRQFAMEEITPEKRQQITLIKNIYNLDENPYQLFLKNLSPHYYKQLLHKQLLSKIKIIEPIPVETILVKPILVESIPVEPIPVQVNLLNPHQITQRATREIIKEARYPLRNRIAKRIKSYK